MSHPKIALLGPPAAGKSTIVECLLRCIPGIKHLDLDREVLALCRDLGHRGVLADEMIDASVEQLMDRIGDEPFVLELPHHDYIAILRRGLLDLNIFDCVLIVSADFKVLADRETQRRHGVPIEYIARCSGATEALCCLLSRSIYPWLKFDSRCFKPNDIAQCVRDFLRRQQSSALSRLEVCPIPGKPYIGGHLRNGVEWDEKLIELLKARAQLKTALDVGCGSGLSIERFENAGISAWGLDGYFVNCAWSHRRVTADFCTQWVEWPIKFDLVWCVEVLEHVPSEYEQNVIQTIRRNVGKIAFITAAPPGQPGFHHVNCKPRTYWIDKFESVSLKYVSETVSILECLGEVGPFGRNDLKANGMLFEA
jgi:methyltransferase family protein